ncbi:YIP1 family protein [Haloferax mediterranei ATCC 33500]|uniref:YIP1 family protein n=1 Tax=Haloferax mediterranei (strain ATCC 33500 / DSM 1411 / JCM 8866 / NBRC 14739 / NCIMB 2177 / R-4) TaxID=523841 RepID=I3R294_HALMT|nr:Yip1 family protein [Haloferax mediterranei]AFK18354.1 hypothetical protein HFX_0630 [Haloferax mediterranei ATCC 33500]AHZ22250.1 hypothetical protein BM92_06095 [Haloferax mediterranei ATCC 33500]EMA02373.1 hypothetical protein C439_07320 [Haloferax mediterranei ATCC 33500]MDX5988445.1 Yip1 family protein [Haloferax mediterranei ATCC 33500]QCQ74865.1 YIP1 family protein [Haloferax mediterranei ATCC 33500]
MSGPRTPLLKPRKYFESKTPPLDFGRALVAVAVVTVVITAGVGGILWTFTQQLDQQVSVDNPEHYPEHACEQYEPGGAFDDMEAPSGCDPSVPETLDKRLGDLIWQEYSWIPLAMLVFVPLVWLFEGSLLHLGSWLVGGDGRFTDSLVVSGWGMVPMVFRVLTVGTFVVYQLKQVSIPSNPEGALNAMQASFSGLGLVSTVAMLVVVAWGTYIRTYGLARARDIDIGSAASVTVGLSLIGLLLELI